MNAIAKSILRNNKYAVLSTVSEDGAPWGTPINVVYDDTNVYWLSSEDAVHSVNIMRDNRVFLTVFNSQQTSSSKIGEHGAVYITTQAHLLSGVEAEKAKEVFKEKNPQSSKIETLNDWAIFRASIGDLDISKTIEDKIYFKEVLV